MFNTWLPYPAAAGSIANALNQYSAVGSVTPSYDGNGNLTFDGTFTYAYDAENRLTSITQGGTAIASYAYDGRGRRKSKTVGGTTTLFVTDADNREVLEYAGSGGAVGNWYAYGLGSNEVLNRMNVAAGTRATMIPDIQGSTVATLDSGSGVLSKAGYLAFGENPGSLTGTFRFTGQRFDAETGGATNQPSGLYYYRARMYSPGLGRFMQPDPVGYQSGVNLYAYVGNDPLNGADPSGLWQVTISGGIVGFGGSVTFGKNSGQWNVGAWAGVGTGLSARVNPFDTGSSASGFDVSAKGQANYNLGTLGGGGFGAQHSLTTGTDTVNGSYSTGFGSNVSGSLSWNSDNTGVNATGHATWGIGSSTFLGVGGTWTSSASQPAQTSSVIPAPAETPTAVYAPQSDVSISQPIFGSASAGTSATK